MKSIRSSTVVAILALALTAACSTNAPVEVPPQTADEAKAIQRAKETLARKQAEAERARQVERSSVVNR